MEKEEKTQSEIEMEEKIAKRGRKTKKRMPMIGKQVFDIERQKRKREQEEN